LRLISILPVDQPAGDLIVAVSENIGFHNHLFLYDAFSRESPAINFRRNPCDYDTQSTV
jgi:hypothetical protein